MLILSISANCTVNLLLCFKKFYITINTVQYSRVVEEYSTARSFADELPGRRAEFTFADAFHEDHAVEEELERGLATTPRAVRLMYCTYFSSKVPQFSSRSVRYGCLPNSHATLGEFRDARNVHESNERAVGRRAGRLAIEPNIPTLVKSVAQTDVPFGAVAQRDRLVI